ncbi:MAG: riboflavin synthase [Deltaproteobacteria bacterium]|nr:MAG: riboflavin synthase [Deltaproteobacteria bacterium]
MFTGLVTCRGRIRAVEPRPEGRRLVVEVPLPEQDRAVGASVCVQGVCLTVVDSQPDVVAFDLGFETLERTTLAGLEPGSEVNVEPSLRIGDALGGHFVTGHVDGVGRVRATRSRGEAREVWFDVPHDLLPMIAPKGSVCVDGVSLTVNAVDPSGFAVGLVPHTLAVTTLDALREGAPVNIEVDPLARYVVRAVSVLSGGGERTP